MRSPFKPIKCLDKQIFALESQQQELIHAGSLTQRILPAQFSFLENYDSSIGHLGRSLGIKVLEARKALKLNLSGMLGGLKVNIFFLKNQKTLNLCTSLTYF